MSSQLSPSERMDLENNPAHLQREIARYLEVRAQAESQLRAVVDEKTGREYFERAQRMQQEAERAMEIANENAAALREKSEAEARKILDRAKQEAESLTKSTNKELDDAREVLAGRAAELVERASALEERSRKLKDEEERAAESQAEAKKLRAEAQSALADMQEKSERLSKLVSEIQEVIGARPKPA